MGQNVMYFTQTLTTAKKKYTHMNSKWNKPTNGKSVRLSAH